MTHEGRGYGKLLLFGEHAAVYGYPALGVGLPWHTDARITPKGSSWKLDQVPQEFRELVSALLDRIATEDKALKGGAVELGSSVPLEAGFGSSAALSVALVAAAVPGITEDIRRWWRVANILEETFHGTPSGVDAGLAIYRSLTSMQPKPPDIPAAWKVPIPHEDQLPPLVVGAVRREASTRELVAGLRERRESGDKSVRSSLETLGGLTVRARQVVTSSHARGRQIGNLAREAQSVLSELGLSTPLTDSVLSLARRAGALGGKLSGGGGGGAFFAVCESTPDAIKVRDQLRADFGTDDLPVLSIFRWSANGLQELEESRAI